jgi:aminoglycoside 3'-phosphotransferase-1
MQVHEQLRSVPFLREDIRIGLLVVEAGGQGMTRIKGRDSKVSRMNDMNREEACTAAHLPASLSAGLIGYEWGRDTVGASGGAVYRLHSKAHTPELFLKHGKDAIADDIADEMVRLRWLGRYVPVPAVVQFTRNDEEAWLLMTAVPGKTVYQILEAYPERRTAVVDAIAGFLRRIHAIPTSECPFTSGHAYRLARARARIDAHLVDEDDFDDEREGWTVEQVWDAMQALLPLTPDSVVTHGDFSLDNLLLLDGEVLGCIDVGRVGIADRYQDLAIAWNCLAEFGVSLQERFLERYGVLKPDRDKLHFHLMLDELF